jgi:hypothetical protein
LIFRAAVLQSCRRRRAKLSRRTRVVAQAIESPRAKAQQKFFRCAAKKKSETFCVVSLPHAIQFACSHNGPVACGQAPCFILRRSDAANLRSRAHATRTKMPIEFQRPLGKGARGKWNGTMGWMVENSSRFSLAKKPRASAALDHKKSERQQTQRQGSFPVNNSDALVARRRSIFDCRLIAHRARTRRSAFS